MSTVRPQPLAEGRFQLIEVIGEGGMATVYRAFDQRLQRPRAIKILSPAFAQRPALRRRFLSEAQTMANLENARVVRVFDMGEDGERVYIVMELVEGGSLVDRVRIHGALPAQMATRVTIELCEALHAAHEHSVIHRDIKPHNVLLTKAGELRITDFGIAQVQADDKAGMTRTGAVLGTWGFMAPEQKSNAKQVDARADIYSVGGTLWSLLKNDTPPELFMTDAEPEWYEGVPEPLAEVIRRATRYRREERYPSARAMADALRAVLPLLPDDPPGTPDLVPRLPERQSNAEVTDTLAQLDPDASRGDRPSEGTMVPDVAGGVNNTLAFEKQEAKPPPVERDPFEVQPARREASPNRFLPVVGGVVALAVAGAVIWFAGPAANRLPLPPETPKAPVSLLPDPVTPPVAPVVAPPVVAPVEALPAPPVAPAEVAVTPLPSPAPKVPTPAPVVVPDKPPVEAVVAPVVPPVERPVDTTPKVPAAPAGKLSTSAPTAAAMGDTVTFTAAIGGKYNLKLYYRGAGGGAFRDKPMSKSGSGYAASVKVDDTMAGGLEYFVAATDMNNTTVRDGSAMKPLRVAIQ